MAGSTGGAGSGWPRAAARSYDLFDVHLDVAAEAGPAIVGAAEGGQVVEVGLASLEGFELLAIVDVSLVAGAVDEPYLLAVAAVGTAGWKQVLGEAAHGSDAGAGGDEDGVGDGLLEKEVSVGAVNLDGSADGQVGQVGEVIGEEALLDAVDAEVEAVGGGGRGDGVGAGLLLAGGVRGDGGDELTGGEGKALEAVEDELEVVALGNFGDAFFAGETGGGEFASQGGFSLCRKVEADVRPQVGL